MKAIYKKRLLKLADLLIKDARNKNGIRFDLGRVVSTRFNADGSDYEPVTVSCGTTACAMGLAAISDAFKRDGVRWEQSGSDINMSIKLRNKKTIYGWDEVAAHLFGLHLYETRWLFMATSYERDNLPTTEAAGERAVAKRLKDFVSGKVFAPLHSPDFDATVIGRFAPAHA